MKLNEIQDQNRNLLVKHKLISVTGCVPRHWLECIGKESVKCKVIFPFQTINVNGCDKLLKNLDSIIVYNILIPENLPCLVNVEIVPRAGTFYNSNMYSFYICTRL